MLDELPKQNMFGKYQKVQVDAVFSSEHNRRDSQLVFECIIMCSRTE